jgi:hypothetical protein
LGKEFGVSGLGFIACSLGYRVKGSRFGVYGLGFRVKGSVRVKRLGFRV